MKKIICLFLLSGFTFCLAAQSITPAVPSPDEAYFKMSKNQKKAAFIVLGAGGVLAVISQTIPPTKSEFNPTTGDISTDYSPRNILLWSGLGVMAGSIPLFIASARNRKRAFGLTAWLKIETATNLQEAAWVKSRYPALSIKISL